MSRNNTQDVPPEISPLLREASRLRIPILFLAVAALIIGTVTFCHERELPTTAGTEKRDEVNRLARLIMESRRESRLMTFFKVFLPVAILLLEAHMLLRLVVESKERRLLEHSLSSFKTAMGRGYYLREITSAIRLAERKILFTTFSMQPSRLDEGQQAILRALTQRIASDDHYEHLGIIAKRPEALPGTFELLFVVHQALKQKADPVPKVQFDVRMSIVLSQTRLRFVTRDGEYCILGLSEGSTELSGLRETTLSFAVYSTMLADSLGKKFSELWDTGQTAWTYLDEIIANSRTSHATYCQDDVMRELGRDPAQLDFREFIGTHSAVFKSLPPGRFDAQRGDLADGTIPP